MKESINLLPECFDNIKSEYVEISDLMGTIFDVKYSEKGLGDQRNTVYTTLNNIVKPKKIVKESGILKRYYLKSDIEQYLNSKATNYKINQKFNYLGKIEDIPYENLLFLHQFNSVNLFGAFIIKPIILPLNVMLLNSFFSVKKVSLLVLL